MKYIEEQFKDKDYKKILVTADVKDEINVSESYASNGEKHLNGAMQQV